LGIHFELVLVTKFQNCGSEYDLGVLRNKNAPMYGMHTNEKMEWFINMYIFCDVLLLPNPLKSAQQHQHTIYV
jgi:hypothetical protein